jgi:hypothetical protein
VDELGFSLLVDSLHELSEVVHLVHKRLLLCFELVDSVLKLSKEQSINYSGECNNFDNSHLIVFNLIVLISNFQTKQPLRQIHSAHFRQRRCKRIKKRPWREHGETGRNFKLIQVLAFPATRLEE